jgi:cytochrome c-type biogenesis protein CcmE
MRLNLYIAVLAVISLFVLSLLSLRKSIVPYDGVKEAMESERTVQVRGRVEGGKANFDPETGESRFVLIDGKGMRMAVSYRGPMPSGYEEAEFIVVVGRFTGGVFNAKRILVKCPSKYRMKGL